VHRPPRRVIAHAAGADRVEDRGADSRGGFVQLLFALQAVAGQVFHRFERCRAGRDDAPGQADGIGGDAQVFRMAEVVGLNQRRVLRVGRADIDPPTALRAQVADRRGERRETCSGSPKRSSDSGCTWYSRLAEGLLRPERANAPSWLGAIDSGPLRSYR
jgi:hypothetical protein